VCYRLKILGIVGSYKGSWVDIKGTSGIEGKPKRQLRFEKNEPLFNDFLAATFLSAPNFI